MVIPSHITEARKTLQRDVRLYKKRSSYVKKFGNLLHSNEHLKPKLKTPQILMIEKIYEYGIKQLEERIIMACASVSAQELNDGEISDLGKKMGETEYRLMAKFLEDLETEESPDYDELPKQLTAETGSHLLHEVLSNLHGELIDRLDTERSMLLDVLVEKDVITESDEENVTSGDSRAERNRRLLSVLSTVPPQKDMTPFVNFLKQEHKDLGERIEASMKELVDQAELPDYLCAACTVVTMVDPRRIAKKMFERRTIPPNFYQDLINPNISNDKKWKMIIKKGFEEEAIYALEPKFQHYFNMFTKEKDLTCTCRDSEVDLRATQRRVNSSGGNSGPSSFRGWSTKTSRNEEFVEMRDKLQRIENSVDDIIKFLRVPRSDQIEHGLRSTSLPDSLWPYHNQGYIGNRFATPTVFGTRPHWSQTKENSGKKGKTKSRNIFSKITKSLARS